MSELPTTETLAKYYLKYEGVQDSINQQRLPNASKNEAFT